MTIYRGSEKRVGKVLKFSFDCNVTQEMIVRNIASAHKRTGAKWVEASDAHNGVAAILAGGPSLKSDHLRLRWLQQTGAKLFALNNVPAYLASVSVFPDAHVLLDALPSVTGFVRGMTKGERYYSSQCDPSVLDAAGDELIIWNPYIQNIKEHVPEARDPFVGGGTTVGTRAIGLAYMLGYRKIHVFGLDSCYQNGAGHAYHQGDHASLLTVTFMGKKYKTPPQLLAQVEEFKNIVPELLANGCELIIHGDGLLPDVAAAMIHQPRETA